MLSYSTRYYCKVGHFNTIKNSNATEGGHTRSQDIGSYQSIRREASVSLLRQSVMPTALMQHEHAVYKPFTLYRASSAAAPPGQTSLEFKGPICSVGYVCLC